MDNRSIQRINELSRKSKTVGLTLAEKAEQQKLRDAYRAAFRKQFTGQIENIDIKEADGSITSLKDFRQGEHKKEE